MKININNWQWKIDDPILLESWFIDLQKIAKENIVKSNSQRDVFTISYKGKIYFVKHSHPTSIFQKLRSSIYPKLVSEYNSSILLEKSNIKTAHAVGVAKKGSQSILITEGIDDAINGRAFWFSKAIANQTLKKQFLNEFALFLKTFFDANLYHPDFHLGNLMVSFTTDSSSDRIEDKRSNSIRFSLIDPYGIVKMNSISESKKLKMVAITGALRGELTEREGGALIKQIIPTLSINAAEAKWLDIIAFETFKTIKLWEKRKGRILSDMRYSQIFKYEAFEIRIRKDFTYKLRIEEESAIKLFNDYLAGNFSNKQFSIIKIDQLKAKKEWLKSFELEFHRLDQNMPLAWISTTDNSNYFIK